MAISGEERGPAEPADSTLGARNPAPAPGTIVFRARIPFPCTVQACGSPGPRLRRSVPSPTRPSALGPFAPPPPPSANVTVDRTSVPRPLSRVCVPEKRPGGGTGSTRSEAGPGPISYLSCPTPLGSVHPVTRGVTGDPRKVASRRAMACAYPTGAHRMLFSSSTPGLSCASR